MVPLNTGDFSEFFEAANDYPPFPWQRRLAEQVLADGRWPELLDLPTGSGKTSALDVALFSVAVDPERSPRRAVLVVDRRVVVDQGYLHARRLLGAINRAQTGILRRVADSLRSCWATGDEELPFAVAVMRGGMPRDDGWARRPDQPLLALSTVDQVGSRLLFRGYGVSPKMAPVHAGLMGNDTLILLDEVHLSVPFLDTLEAIQTRWRRRGLRELPDRWQVVQMSATPGTGVGPASFRLDDTDLGHPVLQQRLDARKPARLVQVKTKSKDESWNKRALAEEAVRQALDQVKSGRLAVAIVVNRVETARVARNLLEVHVDQVDTLLLTGRMRPLDRERILTAEISNRMRCGRNREDSSRPIVIVATQCIEAGADFDFDALVTESASLDALRQRFGRLDRLGELSKTSPEGERSRGVILMRQDLAKSGSDDPVYGNALSKTWTWLKSHGDTVDLGINHLRVPDGTQLEEMLAPRLRAPILLPAHLDAWVQTSPRPMPDPEVGLWLHGPQRGVPDVQIVWRADLTCDLLENSQSGDRAQADLVSLLSACPPGSLEAVSVPFGAARRWLIGEGSTVEVADVPLEWTPSDDGNGGRLAARWQADETVAIQASDLRPGDTIVVPSTYGGLSYGTWDPDSAIPIRDLGDLCQWRLRGRATVRLQRSLLESWLAEPELAPDRAQAWLQATPKAGSGEDPPPPREVREALLAWLKERPDGLPADLLRIIDNLAGTNGRLGFREIAGPGGTWTLVAKRRVRHTETHFDVRAQPQDAEVSTEDDAASFTAAEVSLARHLQDVAAVAGGLARSLGLPQDIADDIRLAASIHDVGKADPRFQQLLMGGSAVRYAALAEPLAKSARPARNARGRSVARERAGFPPGYRHEVLSVAMTEATPSVLESANDHDLVLYLVGSHHGWCRPFAPPIVDSNPRDVELRLNGTTMRARTDHGLARLDSGVSDRFWRLVERYGWWGLAWLETVMRLADHRASETEQMETELQ